MDTLRTNRVTKLQYYEYYDGVTITYWREDGSQDKLFVAADGEELNERLEEFSAVLPDLTSLEVMLWDSRFRGEVDFTGQMTQKPASLKKLIVCCTTGLTPEFLKGLQVIDIMACEEEDYEYDYADF